MLKICIFAQYLAEMEFFNSNTISLRMQLIVTLVSKKNATKIGKNSRKLEETAENCDHRIDPSLP
jgi:hypothetical protein